MNALSNSKKTTRRFEYTAMGLVCFLFAFGAFSSVEKISKDQLKSIEVTLEKKPEFAGSKSMKHYKFITKEYAREFRATGFVLDALDRHALRRDIRIGDKLVFWIKQEDAFDLREKTLINDFNYLYGLQKNGRDYVDLETRNVENKEDAMYGWNAILLGIISIIYLIWDDKIQIRYSMTMWSLFFIGCFVIYILNHYNLLVKQ